MPIGGPVGSRRGAPGEIGARTSLWTAESDALFRSLSQVGAVDSRFGLHDLLRSIPQPSDGPTLARTLRDLAQTYVPAQGLGGSLHYDEALPDLDVPEGPLRAILEHLVEGALRGNDAEHPFCHVAVVSDNDERLVLSIRDNGVSLPECSIEEMRQFLRQAGSMYVPDRVHRLFLAENLAQWLGGRLSVGPTPGAAGATVLLEIPKDGAGVPGDALVGRHVF
jgi:hypothetical protein